MVNSFIEILYPLQLIFVSSLEFSDRDLNILFYYVSWFCVARMKFRLVQKQRIQIQRFCFAKFWSFLFIEASYYVGQAFIGLFKTSYYVEGCTRSIRQLQLLVRTDNSQLVGSQFLEALPPVRQHTCIFLYFLTTVTIQYS